MHSVFNVNHDNLLFDQGVLLMNEKDNWLVFIPAKHLAFKIQRELLVQELEAELREPLKAYSLNNKHTSANYNQEHRTAFVYGLGVE